jgi:hypothetical protein
VQAICITKCEPDPRNSNIYRAFKKSDERKPQIVRKLSKKDNLPDPESGALDRLLSLIYNLSNHLDSRKHQMEREEPHG